MKAHHPLIRQEAFVVSLAVLAMLSLSLAPSFSGVSGLATATSADCGTNTHCLFRVAAMQGEASLCEGLADSNLITGCVSYVESVEKRTAELVPPADRGDSPVFQPSPSMIFTSLAIFMVITVALAGMVMQQRYAVRKLRDQIEQFKQAKNSGVQVTAAKRFIRSALHDHYTPVQVRQALVDRSWNEEIASKLIDECRAEGNDAAA
ncbi:MAG: hypothetical protein ABIC95_04695 [archaeon]